jgi:hypothetical protein
MVHKFQCKSLWNGNKPYCILRIGILYLKLTGSISTIDHLKLIWARDISNRSAKRERSLLLLLLSDPNRIGTNALK